MISKSAGPHMSPAVNTGAPDSYFYNESGHPTPSLFASLAHLSSSAWRGRSQESGWSERGVRNRSGTSLVTQTSGLPLEQRGLFMARRLGA